MRLRGELCIGAATVLSFFAVILVIFAHVGQINTSTVPRKLSMLNVNVSGYGEALEQATGDPSDNLYATNISIPLGQGSGLRESYAFGLYSYCGYVNASLGSCSNSTTALQVQPYEAMLDDMNGRFTSLTRNFVPDLSFTNSHYTGQFTRAAYYLLLMGSICAALAMITGIPKRTYTFLLSTMFAILGTGLLFIGCVIYTVVINKMKDVNRATVTNTETGDVTPLGITVSPGSSLWLFWTSFVCLFLSIVPYLVSCCTYRG